MSLHVLSLNELLRSAKKEKAEVSFSTQETQTKADNENVITERAIQKLLLSFKTMSAQDSTGADDVEEFLHKKAIQFENMDLARTYLVMSTYRSSSVLVGYFSISNKPLTLPSKQFRKLSNGLQKRLMGMGYKSEQSSYVVKGYLLGQVGKNFSEESLSANCCSGNDLLQLAYHKIAEVHRIVGGRVLHLECEDVPKIIQFYQSNGFNLIEGFKSENGYCMMIKQLKDIL